MIVPLLFAVSTASCDAALEGAVRARLEHEPSRATWSVQCLDRETVLLVRMDEEGVRRSRSVSLVGVAPALAIEVVELGARALTRPALPPPAAPASALPEVAPTDAAGVVKDAPVGVETGPAREALASPVRSNRDAEDERPGPPLRGAPWQRSAGRRAGPLAHSDLRWFPANATWLAGAGGGVEYGPYRVELGVAFGKASGGPLDVQRLSAELKAALALICVVSVTVSGCARAAGNLGAAFVSSSSDAAVATASARSLLVGGGLVFEATRALGAALVSLSCFLGATAGPRAVVAGAAGPTWAGLTLGVAGSVAF